MDQLTIDQFKEALPASMRRSFNTKLLNEINQKLADPDMYETYRENLLGYVHVMRNGKFQISKYIDAVKYVSHKLMGHDNKTAFVKTFPSKISTWNAQGVTSKDQASYIAAYNKSKLVNLIYEQTLTPFWVMNQDVYQKAINVQAELMITAASEKVRTDAANSLLNHLKPPETQKIELDIGVKKDSVIEALRAGTQALVNQQRSMLESGSMNIEQIAHTNIIVDEEVVDEQ